MGEEQVWWSHTVNQFQTR